MELWQIVAIGIAVVAVVVVGWLMYTRTRSRRLQDRFGAEYDRRLVEFGGNRRRAEAELTEQQARIQRLRSRPLSSADHARFLSQWRMCQAKFVDDPAGAVSDADRLLSEIMQARGYTADDRQVRLDDLCAAYPERASDFREAHDVLSRDRAGTTSTEHLREAFVRFRSLFDEMLGGHDEELKRAS